MSGYPVIKQKRPAYKYLVKKGYEVKGVAYSQTELSVIAEMPKSQINQKFMCGKSFKNGKGYSITRVVIPIEEARKHRPKTKKAKLKKTGIIVGLQPHRNLMFCTFHEFYKIK